MKSSSLLPVLFIVSILAACNSGERKANEHATSLLNSSEEMNADKSSAGYSAYKGGAKERKFIRTATLRFKTDDVIKSTSAIENIVRSNGGFITLTTLKNDYVKGRQVQVSKDSILNTGYYDIHNSITLRIPDYRLDTTLTAISAFSNHLDSRVITADDVSLDILSEKMKQGRALNALKKTPEQKATPTQNNNNININILKENADDANSSSFDLRADADDAGLSILSLNDQVKFSTVSLDIYQNEILVNEMIPVEKIVTPYEPPFGEKIVVALKGGLEIIKNVILFFVSIWPIIVITLMIFTSYKIIRARRIYAGNF
jgi:hypothetical protein